MDKQISITKLLNQMDEGEVPEWDMLPDIALYKDQVLLFLERHIGLGGGEPLTGAMINNYIKSGLIPRTNGKKYGKEHLAKLHIISALKNVLTVSELKSLFDAASALEDKGDEVGQTGKPLYTDFRDKMDASIRAVREGLDGEEDEDALFEIALELVVSAHVQKTMGALLLKMLDDNKKLEGNDDKKD